MKANVLIVSVDEFPVQTTHNLENHGFSCFFSRGGIKTREILKTQQIDTIIWFYLGHEQALALDLLKIFNRYQTIPVILVTQNYDELDFAEGIQNLFANIDLNDDIDDYIRALESSCNIHSDDQRPTKRKELDPPEIDFRNAVSQILNTPFHTNGDPQSKARDHLENTTLWNAVDQNEKKILSAPLKPSKRAFLDRIREWLD